MSDRISYRVGRHQAQNVYRHGPGDPPDGSYIGVFFNPETAALVCEALNGRQDLALKLKLAEEERDQLRARISDAEEYISDLESSLSGDVS